MDSITMGNWITAPQEMGTACPVFKRRFSVQKPVADARLHLSALGLYEPVLNGQRVTDARFLPGFTDYAKRIQYQTFTVTALLQPENELCVTVGPGWCVGRFGFEGKSGLWNDRMALIGVLELTYEDGSCELLITDRDWVCTESAIRFSNLYDGEVFDAAWQEPAEVPVALYPYSKEKLFPQEGLFVKEQDRLPVKQVLLTPKGETVLDFGQNLTGYVAFRVTGPKGAKATLRHGEVLDSDGNFYTANLRTAREEVTVLCNGEGVTYHPHFSFQGFRYVQLVDWPEAVDPENFTAFAVHSDLTRTGYFSCDVPKVNRLYQNILWGQKGNFLDIPTDCPQRDERLGWTGDAQVFVRAASYNYDVHRFFVKWLHDLKLGQRPDGSVPVVIPTVPMDSWQGSPSGWGDAAVICPWQIYLSYGDKQVLEDQFDSMKAWVDYIRNSGEVEELWNTGEQLSDWLALDAPYGSYKGATDEYLIATAYYAYSTSLLIKAGHALGRDVSLYEKLYPRIVRAYQETFMDGDTVRCETQTAQVLTLAFDLCAHKKPVADRLAQMIHDNGDRLTTGFLGTPYLLHVLSDNGYTDLAYTLLLQEEFPSWLFSVNMGATTIWEHWDGMRPDGTMWSTDMNSFNHYAYGAVADWLYGVAAGIKPSEEEPGYRRILLAPQADHRLGSVTASLKTAHGTIRSSWRYQQGEVIYEFTVPEGCIAEIRIGRTTQTVTGGVYSFRS